MKKFVVVLMLCLSASVSLAEAPKLTPDKDGYLPLFNGKDLSGWEIWSDKSDFKIKDGIIRCEHGGGGQFMLYTAQEFSDFELVVEWRVSPKGNSGVFIRSPFKEWPWETAYEIQISNEQPPRDVAHCTGSLYGYADVNPRPNETPGQWRTYVIRAEGKHITVKVDGVQVVDFNQDSEDKTKDKPLRGFLGVQDSHSGDDDTWVEYRTIKVKPLD